MLPAKIILCYCDQINDTYIQSGLYLDRCTMDYENAHKSIFESSLGFRLHGWEGLNELLFHDFSHHRRVAEPWTIIVTIA